MKKQRSIDEEYDALRPRLSKFGVLGGGAVAAPVLITVTEADGSPTGLVNTVILDQAPTTGGFTLTISGPTASVGIGPYTLLLDGTRAMTGNLNMGGKDIINLRDIQSIMRDIVNMQDIQAMRDIVSMIDIESMNDIRSGRDIISWRDIISMQDILKVRDIKQARVIEFNVADPGDPSNPWSNAFSEYPKEGSLYHNSYWYNATAATYGLQIDTEQTSVKLLPSRNIVVRAINRTGGTLTRGQSAALRGEGDGGFSGSDNEGLGIFDADPYLARTTPTNNVIWGVVANDIVADAFGYVIVFGPLIDFTGDWLIDGVGYPGQGVYLAADNRLTVVDPGTGQNTTLRQRLGIVTKLVTTGSESGNGHVFICPDMAHYQRQDEEDQPWGYAGLDSKAYVPHGHSSFTKHFIFGG